MSEEIQPLADRVLVQPIATETKLGNIIVDPNQREKPSRGTVIDRGISCKEVQPNDAILYGKHAGVEVTVDGKKLLLMREAEIFAILKPKS